ncbi:MAG: Ig-like domain-containing protein, partial [Acidobacteria bacterium]|nr:Ig-like domain-containing protein [Acidobacteriota bacterium]
MKPLGFLSGFPYSNAQAVSSDGSIVVGSGNPVNGGNAVRWVKGAIERLLPLGRDTAANAFGVSADGTVIVGRSSDGVIQHAVRWANGTLTDLGLLPGGARGWSVAKDVSADGQVIVGTGDSNLGSQAFRWENNRMTGLGLFGGRFESDANAVSGDGTLIVGYGTTASGTEAFVWDATHGMRNLKEVLSEDYKLDLAGWRLEEATDVSSDGTTIVGRGINPQGKPEAWIARLAGPCPTNQLPTIDPIADLTLDEDALDQTILLTGITSGSANERQTLTVMATSDNPALIPNPSVIYASPAATGTLSFRPLPDANGTAKIAVRVNDGSEENSTTTSTFTVTVRPVNDPPTINSIGNPLIQDCAVEHTIQLSGISAGPPNESNQVLSITAVSSNPSVVPHPKVEYSSPSAVGWLILVPVPNSRETVQITVRVNDGGGTENGGVQETNITFTIMVDCQVVNTPPVVEITRPLDRTIFQLREPILIEAKASDREGQVQRVEFYVDEIWQAASSSAPYAFTWSDTTKGGHVLKARAVDQAGLIAESAPVRVAVGDACEQGPISRVALLRNVDGPEIETLLDYLFDLGVNAVSIAAAEASFANLSQLDLAIWYDNGALGLSEREVELFEQLALANIPLYFIGDALLASMPRLGESVGSRWSQLLHLRPKTVPNAPSQIIIEPARTVAGDEEIIRKVIQNGIAGTVVNFVYPLLAQGGEQTGLDGEIILGRADGLDVIVAFQESGAGRGLTQTFPVTGGTDELSLAERKKLFQNAVWWLLEFCVCDNLNLLPEDGTSPKVVEIGEEITLTIDVKLSGGCEALSVAVSNKLPPGVEFQSARSSRGDWNYTNGVVTFYLGRLPRGAEERLEVIVRATQPGSFTAQCKVRSLNERSGSLPDNEI